MTPLVVYDTMLFFQAAAQNPPRLHGTFQALDAGTVRLCMSQELYDEIADVLTRPEIRKKAPSLTTTRVAQFLAKVKSVSRWFDEVPHVFTLAGHSDDDHIFNLAIAAQAQFLITWEGRILKLEHADSEEAKLLRTLAPVLAILSPVDFAAKLKHKAWK